MNSHAARLLITALGAAFVFNVIARETAQGGSSVAAAIDEAQQPKGKNKGQAQSPAPNSPEAVAESIWQKISTSCSVQGSAKPVLFYEDGDGQLNAPARLFEFRDAWTIYLPEDLSEADRLNGVQSRGVTILGYSASRSIYGRRNVWGEFGSGSAKQSAFLAYKRCDPKVSACNMLPLHDMEVTMEKRNGQWAFKAVFFFHAYPLDPDAVADKKRSCAALTSANPFAAQ